MSTSSVPVNKPDDDFLVVGRLDGTPLHLTLAFRNQCWEGDIQAMVDKAEGLLETPIVLQLGRHIWVGPKEELESVSVSFPVPDQALQAKTYWDKFNRRSIAEAHYTFAPHITLNSVEKRQAMRELERNGHQATISRIFLYYLTDKRSARVVTCDKTHGKREQV